MQAELTPATEQDVEETMPLLDDLQARDLVPEVRLVDSGYGSCDVLAKPAALGIELVGPLKQEGGWQHETGYGVSAFQVDWQQQQVRCPQGHLSQNWCPGRHNRGEEVIRVSFSAVTCQACPVKARCTKREKHKGRILTLSPQPIHEARERRRAEQATSALRASLCLAGRHRRHDFRRPSLSWDAPGALSWSAKDAAASPGHRGSHQLGPHPSDAATHAAWTLAPTQASFVSFCTFATALGDMMSGQNFPAESFIHPGGSLLDSRQCGCSR